MSLSWSIWTAEEEEGEEEEEKEEEEDELVPVELKSIKIELLSFPVFLSSLALVLVLPFDTKLIKSWAASEKLGTSLANFLGKSSIPCVNTLWFDKDGFREIEFSKTETFWDKLIWSTNQAIAT